MSRLIGILIAVGVALAIAYALVSSGPEVPDSSVLVMEIGGELTDAPALDTFEQLFASGPALPTMVLQLDKAAADERISAVLLHLRPLGLGFAQIQELRGAVARVRAVDKPVVALLEVATLNATRELYLASAADQIYVVPAFLGPLAGIAGQFMHLGGLLAKLGIVVEYERIGEYKAAPEMFASREMSEPARENANALLDGLFEQIVSGIASGRSLAPDRVRELIDAAPSTSEEWLAAGLADGVAGRHEVLDAAGLGESPEIRLDVYGGVDPRSLGLRSGPAVALVFGHGTIVPGEGDRRNRGFAAERIARALQAAADDEEVRAIVLRVDSGGGSALASDRLWRVIRRVGEKTPVVISMGNAAASGGYYLASASNTIVAQPGTITGSIGVFLLRPSFAGLYEKLDVGAEVIARGDLASITSSSEALTPAQRERTRTFVRSLYDQFLDRVAVGRELDPARVDELGRGQVWLGQAAAERGLVDAMGGLHTAVELAKEKGGIDADVDPERRIFPGPRSVGEQLRDLMRGDLHHWLRAAILPADLPPVLDGISLLLEGEIAYLPAYWIEIR
jgi:protease-4